MKIRLERDERGGVGLGWAFRVWQQLTEAGPIRCPPPKIGVFLEAVCFILTASVNEFCKAIFYNHLG